MTDIVEGSIIVPDEAPALYAEIARLRNELHIVEVWSARIIAGTQQDVTEIARLTARVDELENLASSYLQAAKQVGGCADSNCVVLRPTGMHTNGGCRCTHDMDRARERGVARLLGMAQHIAHAAITQEKRDD